MSVCYSYLGSCCGRQDREPPRPVFKVISSEALLLSSFYVKTIFLWFSRKIQASHVKGAVMCKWKGWYKGVVLMFIFLLCLPKKLQLVIGAGDLVVTLKPWTQIESPLIPLTCWIRYTHFWWVSGLKIIVDFKKKSYISRRWRVKVTLFSICWSVEISLSHGWALWTCGHIIKWSCNLAWQARGILKVIKGKHWLICLWELHRSWLSLCFCVSASLTLIIKN